LIGYRTFLLPSFLVVFLSACLQTVDRASLSKQEIVSVTPRTDSPQISSSETITGNVSLPHPDSFSPSSNTGGKKLAALPPLKPVISKPAREPASKVEKKDGKIRISSQKIQSILDEALGFCEAAQDFWQKGELENAIEALDQAYSLILNIDVENAPPELMQQKEDLRFTISKRILEIYASRNIVVNGNHNAIPLTLNHYIKAEIYLFTEGKEKDFFLNAYRRSGRYRPHIVKALREAGLPTELSWLPLIESGFKVNAMSRARALGLWQFIPSTGYKFGLKRDYYIDERLDPEKSTRAAIAYLKELHQIFGDWTTVLAAYNCGEGKVLRVIRTQNVNYLDNFWDLYERLPRETARYVPRFLATLHILNNKKKYGLENVKVDPPLTFETVPINRSVHLRDVARKIGVSERTMKALNPELRYKVVPAEKYPLRVPVGKKQTLLAKLETIPVTSRIKQAYLVYRVKRGDTLGKIAKRYHTTINSIIRANNINSRNFIVAGQTLRIPQKRPVLYVKKYKKLRQPLPAIHVVKGGDSLWIIARHYGTTTKKIQDYNNMRSTRLRIGQVLRIPKEPPETTPEEGFKTYRVRRGDSPFRIARRHNMGLEQFLRINHLTPRSKIYPGQVLFVE